MGRVEHRREGSITSNMDDICFFARARTTEADGKKRVFRTSSKFPARVQMSKADVTWFEARHQLAQHLRKTIQAEPELKIAVFAETAFEREGIWDSLISALAPLGNQEAEEWRLTGNRWSITLYLWRKQARGLNADYAVTMGLPAKALSRILEHVIIPLRCRFVVITRADIESGKELCFVAGRPTMAGLLLYQ